MSAFELTLIVVFMAVVTYMPRMLPLVFLRDIKMPPICAPACNLSPMPFWGP